MNKDNQMSDTINQIQSILEAAGCASANSMVADLNHRLLGITKPKRTMSISAVSTYHECPTKYDHVYNSKLEPIKTAQALRFGSLGHAVLEQHYIQQMPATNDVGAMAKQVSPVQVLDQLRQKEIDEKYLGGEGLEQLDQDTYILQGMYEAYTRYWGTPDKQWPKILAVEQRITNPYPFFGDKGTPDAVHHLGIIDLIAEDDDGRIWVIDHKFLRTVDDGLTAKLALDLQMVGYQILVNAWLKEQGDDRKVYGAVYNVIKKSGKRQKKGQSLIALAKEMQDEYLKNPDKYFFRFPVIVTAHHQRYYHSTMNGTAKQMMDSKLEDNYPMHPKACDMWGKCSFLSLCLEGDSAKHLYRPRRRR